MNLSTEEPSSATNLSDSLPFSLEIKSFSEWFNSFETDDEISCLQMLCSTLQALNKEKVEIETRFLFLEHLFSIVTPLMERVSAYPIKSSFPFSDQDKEKIELSVLCCTETVKSYLILCKEKAFYNNEVFSQEQKAFVLYNAIKASDYALLYQSVLYQQPEKGFWEDCYLLYLFARKNDSLELKLDQDNSCFIKVFKHLLLFQLINSQQFSSEEMIGIFLLLRNFDNHLLLPDQVLEKSIKNTPYINLKTDHPPAIFKGDSLEDTPFILFISSSNIIKLLFENLSNKKLKVVFSKVTLLRLIKALSMNQQRKSDRELAKGQLKAIIGFDQIVDYIQDKQKLIEKNQRVSALNQVLDFSIVEIYESDVIRPQEDFRTDTHANRVIINDVNNINNKVQSSDIWQKKTVKTAEKEEQSDSNAEYKDKSSSGVCICLHDKAITLKVGDLIGLEVSGDIELGIVRRIIGGEDEQFKIGVELLGCFSNVLHIFNTGSKVGDFVFLLNQVTGGESIVIKATSFNNEPFLFSDNDDVIKKYCVERQIGASSMVKHLKVALN